MDFWPFVRFRSVFCQLANKKRQLTYFEFLHFQFVVDVFAESSDTRAKLPAVLCVFNRLQSALETVEFHTYS